MLSPHCYKPNSSCIAKICPRITLIHANPREEPCQNNPNLGGYETAAPCTLYISVYSRHSWAKRFRLRLCPSAPSVVFVNLRLAAKLSDPEPRLRMGVHSGPISGVIDLNGKANVAGAGINMAQRVMDCGDAGHILVSNQTYPGPLWLSPRKATRLGLPSRGDFPYLNLGLLAGRSASFKCCYSTDNSPFRPAYHATCAPNAAGRLACPAPLLPGGCSPNATYRTRNSSSLAARLAFSAACNTSYAALRSPSLSFCSWHNAPPF